MAKKFDPNIFDPKVFDVEETPSAVTIILPKQPVKLETMQKAAILVYQKKQRKNDAAIKMGEAHAETVQAQFKTGLKQRRQHEAKIQTVQTGKTHQTVKLDCLTLPLLIQIIELAEEQLWRFNTVGDDKTCLDCAGLDGKIFHIEKPKDLVDAFPYGEIINNNTFKPNVHTNCRCVIKRLE